MHLRRFFAAYALSREPWAIGSYGRGTVIRRERDVDVMVVLAAKPYVDRFRRDSRAFLYWLRDALNVEYANTRVSTRKVALCMDLGDGLGVDLVPAFDVIEVKGLSWLTRRPLATPGEMGFYIPNGNGGWQITNPAHHDALMQAADVRLASKLKPLVRLMKLWNRGEHDRLRSFHLEMMVERAWRKTTQMPPLPVAMRHTLEAVAGLTNHEFSDPWPQGGRLDQYIDGETRRKAVKALRDDAQRATDALAYENSGNQRAAFDRWSVVFGRDFTGYG
jgi:hypothetical protein